MMRGFVGGAGLASDNDKAPTGVALLHGLNVRRLGIVFTLCLLYAIQSVSEYFAVGFTRESALGIPIKLAVICVAALPFTVLVTMADNLSSRWRTSYRVLSLVLAVIVGAACSGLIEASLYWAIVTGPPPFNSALWDVHASYISLVLDAYPLDFLLAPLGTFWGGVRFNVWTGFSVLWLLYGGFLTSVYFFVSREQAAAAALHESQILRQALDRQMTEARLQVLQAQIEPHFLFNTLATIGRLYQIAPDRGKAMLSSLADYLHAALPHMREARSTLMRELQLTTAYLNVQQIRMGDRLKVEKMVPPELLAASIPPMMLLTLVENAIKHGLNPLPRGGTIRIRATREGDQLKIAVEDNGAGFHQPAGAGVGLANTRARLATLYGSAGRLRFEGNDEGGVSAAIELPCRLHQPEGATA